MNQQADPLAVNKKPLISQRFQTVGKLNTATSQKPPFKS
jgi:hypothetical protein